MASNEPTRSFMRGGPIVLVLAVVSSGCSGGSDSSSSADTGPPTATTTGPGSGPGGSRGNGAGGGGAGGARGECRIDADCTWKLTATTPPDCAEAKCDSLQHKCQFLAKDADMDGHRAKTCSGGLLSIQTGDDCNDNDPNTYPGAW